MDYEVLARKMYFEELNGEKISLSYGGNNETFNDDYSLTLKWNKWRNDTKWDEIKSYFNYEYISIFSTDNKEYVYIETKHIDVLTVDRRAVYIMVIELAKQFMGRISEDSKKTFLTLEEFEDKHRGTLKLNFSEANEISFKEIDRITAVTELEEKDIDYSS